VSAAFVKGQKAWVTLCSQGSEERWPLAVTVESMGKYITVTRHGWRFGDERGLVYFNPQTLRNVTPAKRLPTHYAGHLRLFRTYEEAEASERPAALFRRLRAVIGCHDVPVGVTEADITQAAILLGFTFDLAGNLKPIKR
jgi:hypothetical protein